MKNHYSAPTIAELLPEHELTHQDGPQGEILILRTGHEHGGIYNGTAPIKIGEKTLIAARVDYPGSEEADTEFFCRNGSPTSYDYDPSLPTLRGLQDPSITVIGDEYYVGGVRVYVKETNNNGRVNRKIVDWDPVLRKVSSLGELDDSRPADVVGPMGSKGLHPLGKDGELAGHFIRTADGKDHRGKVRYLPLENGQEITPDALATAPVVEPFIADRFGEWGGISQPEYVEEHLILAAMHLARFGRLARGVKPKDYYGGLALLEEEMFKGKVRRLNVVTQMLVSCRSCFPNADTNGNVIVPKSEGLENVSYLKGVSLEEQMGYCGVSDSAYGRLAVGQALSKIAA